MPIEILMPALSPTMTEGTLAKWLKKEGDVIKAGDVIAEIETDKATMEVEAVDEGTLAKIIVPAGTDNVAVNQIIALILEEGEDTSNLGNYSASDANLKLAAKEEQAPIAGIAEKIVATSSNADISSGGDRIFATPLAKKIARNENIDLSTVGGTGPRNRIIRDDVMSALSNNSKSAAPSMVKASPAPSAAPATGAPVTGDNFTKIPNNNMRKVIAKRLLESKQTVPHFYLTIECNIDNLMTLRKQINDGAGEKNSYKISVNDFVIKASAMALAAVPEANTSWTDEAILQYNTVDISVAVAIDGGLITPIIRDADKKSLSIISNEMKSLASKAREGKLQPHEYQGGGFSISNLGMYGITQFSAIINPPQSCIIAVGAGIERAIVQNGEVKIATMVNITLSCDHRVVDGAVGANFLNKLKQYLENPMSMLV